MAEVRMAVDGVDGPRRIVGYGAVFNSLSQDLGGFREIVLPGFFDEVLLDDVRCLNNHDPNQLLGRTASGTMTIRQDELGLRFDTLSPDTSYGHDLQILIDRGDVDQSSFGWFTKEDRWEERPDGTVIRYLVKAERLVDVGPVTFPAYTATSAQMRSMMGDVPEIPAGLRGATKSADSGDDQGQASLDIKRRRLDLVGL